MKKHIIYGLLMIATFAACTKQDFSDAEDRQPALMASKSSLQFQPISKIVVGSAAAAEISAYDPLTRRLFVVNNCCGLSSIDVLDLSDPQHLTPASIIHKIDILPYGTGVNSVDVFDGKLAAAVEVKVGSSQMPGKLVVFNTSTYEKLAEISVGALPDMVTFSPDGNMILTANEGEPSSDYSFDPVGSVSIVEVNNNYAVRTIGFGAFAGQAEALKAKGLRIFGPGASFEQDLEPEYIAVSANSKTAWVSLQENNAIAKIDLVAGVVTDIFPLGFKDYSIEKNAMDLSDQDGVFGNFKPWPVRSVYLPDAVAVVDNNGTPFVYSANEGDAREYGNFVELKRVGSGSVLLDASAFPNAAELKLPNQLGRLNITTTMGDKDGDGDFDELYSIGGRSFSIWNGQTGSLIFDSGDELDKLAVKAWEQAGKPAALNIDNRSDDKGAEPESVTTGRIGNSTLLFVGMERADAVAVYDITNGIKPVFMQWISTGDAPEGIKFVAADKSPTGKPMLIVSCEDDGTVYLYQAS